MNQAYFPVTIVKSACIRFLNERLKTLQELQEPLIQKEMKGNWFKKPKSRDQAIDALYGDIWNDYSMIELNYTWSTFEILRLKEMCEVCRTSQDIFLDTNTVHILRKYL